MFLTSVQDKTRDSKLRESVRYEQQLLLTVTFAGLGTGFISFWLTLALVYSGIFGVIGALVVWFFVRGIRGGEFADKTFVLFVVSALIGVGVGYASSFGSGFPIGLL